MKRALALLALLATTVSAQPATRRATNLAALLAHPTFYQLRPIVLVGEVSLQNNGEIRVNADGTSLKVIFTGTPPDGVVEVRGEYMDIGRMNADDPRLRRIDLKRQFNVDPEGPWPQAGQAVAIVASAIERTTPPSGPSIRNIVLYPSRYADQQVTLTGQFAGRNLLGDIADAPAISRYDFVVRSADAAIWVANIRPRGRDFELSLDQRIDTGRWVEVSGKLQQGRGLQWLDATEGIVKLVPAPKETPQETRIELPPAPAPEVVFSAPTADETDVSPTTSVRIQFSRDIDPATFRTRINVRYAPSAGAPTEAPAPEFTTQYLPGTRVLEIKFKEPLARFRKVILELQEGVAGTDKQPLVPWAVSFETGNQ
jgi:hypothetical protein